MENWKAIPEYEGLYEVSDTGKVRSLDHYAKTDINNVKQRLIKGRTLRLRLKSMGYYYVDLCKNGAVKNEAVHRLVALAFIPNPEKLSVVNHIDGDKLNNCASNLEWTSYKENHWHARNTGLLTDVGQYQNKTVECIEEKKTFKNSREAARWLIQKSGLKSAEATVSGNIRRCAKGGTPKAYGFHWVFI